MKINKWNNLSLVYEQVEVPDDWNIKTYSDDMNEEINCVCCGKKITFGEGYTSRRFHKGMGMGYAECEECYFAYEVL